MKDAPNNPTLRWLVETFGTERAFEIVSRFAFSRWYVPENRERARSDFVAFLSADELSHFQALWSREYIKIPLSRAFCCQFLAFTRELRNTEIAREMKMTEDGVGKALSVDLGFRVSFPAGKKSRLNATGSEDAA